MPGKQERSRAGAAGDSAAKKSTVRDSRARPSRPAAGSKKKGGEGEAESGRRGDLKRLLAEAAEDLDEEGLEFLLNQANVLIYNAQVEKLNARMRKVREAGGGTRKKGAPGADTPGADTPAPAAGIAGAADVEIIEKEESGNFFIVVDNYRILFTREEMRSLVKICRAAADARDAANRLYNWFQRNRQDLLIDGGIAGRTHPSLERIYRILVSRYRVRGEG